MIRFMGLIGLTLYFSIAVAATTPVSGKYKCTGTSRLTVFGMPFGTDPAKTDPISAKLMADKTGAFNLTITTAGYQNLISGRISSTSSSSMNVDVGNYSFEDLYAGRLPPPLWSENRTNISSSCGCSVGAEFYTSASGTRIQNARRITLNVEQEWRKRGSTLANNYVYTLSCKK